MTETTASQPTVPTDAEYSPGPVATPPIKPLGVLVRLVIAFVLTLLAYGPSLLIGLLPVMNVEADALAGNWALVLIKQAAPIATIPLAAIGAIWLLNRFVDHRPFKVSGIRLDRRSLPALLLGTVISLLAIVPAAILLGRLGLAEVAEVTSNEPLWVGVISALILGYLMQGGPEEFVWRGWVSQSVGGGWWRQAIITSIAFGCIHVISNISTGGHENVWVAVLYMASAGAFGFAGAALYFATGSIWAAVGIHGGLHLANHVALLNGGAAGWQLDIVLIVLYCLIGVIVMRRLPDSRS